MKGFLLLLLVSLLTIVLILVPSGPTGGVEVLNVTELPEPRLDSNYSFERAVLTRRSVRDYTSEPLTLEEVSQLLWAGQGLTSGELRAAPSAGALYPFELYIASDRGVHHYKPADHSIELLNEGDVRSELGVAALHQDHVTNAAAVIILSAVYDRITGKYGNRGVMYAHIEAGHITQNILLQATVLGLGACPVGAFNPNEFSKIMGLPSNEEVVYIITVGHV